MDPAASNPTPPLSTFTPQSDSSKYIRTFAKDVAALTGMPAPRVPAAVAKPAPPTPPVAPDTHVSVPDYDPSPVNNANPASPKEFAQEKVDLTAADSVGIFAKHPEPVPDPSRIVPLMPQAAIAPSVNVQAPETDADREAILARLRAKVAAQQTAVQEPTENSLRTAAPDFATIPEPVLPMPQVQKQEVPAPQPTPQENPSPIHTYSSDFADRIDTEKSSTFSVLAAQSDAGQTARSAPHKRNFLPLLAGAAMLLVGIGAIVGAYVFTQHGNTVPTVAGVPSLIPFDESVEVKGTGQALMQAISDAAQGGIVSGNVVVTYVTLATTTGSGIPQPGGVLIKNLGLSAPDILLRNIADTSTVGVVQAGTESRPFMVLKVNSYERTFAGMLAWEPAMRDALATLYPSYPSVLPTGTSTASTTRAISKPAPTTFTDAVVANYDVRVLRDTSGRSLLLYGYRGKDLLIIARNEAAFTALVSRLSASGN